MNTCLVIKMTLKVNLFFANLQFGTHHFLKKLEYIDASTLLVGELICCVFV